MVIKCPHCGKEPTTIRVTYSDGEHSWDEDIDRPKKQDRSECPTFRIPPRSEIEQTTSRRMMMPFGKYGPKQGDHRAVEDLPLDYIEWALGNLSLRDDLREEMENQVELKHGHGVRRRE